MSAGARTARPGRTRASNLRACLAPLFAAFGLGSCLSVRWEREQRFEELSAKRIEAVEVGRSDLGECLARFGAPLYVWELPDGAFSIAYGWAGDRRLGGTLRIPVARSFSPSYSYDDFDESLEGLVLLFDRDATLQVLRRGYLRDIARELERPRPADVEDAEPSASDG